MAEGKTPALNNEATRRSRDFDDMGVVRCFPERMRQGEDSNEFQSARSTLIPDVAYQVKFHRWKCEPLSSVFEINMTKVSVNQILFAGYSDILFVSIIL